MKNIFDAFCTLIGQRFSLVEYSRWTDLDVARIH